MANKGVCLITVKVLLPGFSEYYLKGLKEAEVEGSKVDEVLHQLMNKYPKLKLLDKNGKLLSHLGIYVNGEIVYPEEFDRLVQDGDELSIVMMFDGG